MQAFDVVIIGGGASGYFTAINLAEQKSNLRIAIIEKAKQGLQKVKISGGGRCNVTHAEFIPQELIKHYPRGQRELLGPFHTFMTGDTIEWFAHRGVDLHIEEDGRMFPTTNSSQTIIDCFLSLASKYQIKTFNQTLVKEIAHQNKQWQVITQQGICLANQVVIATGSNNQFWKLLSNIGLQMVNPVPSLFTFCTKDPRIIDIPGLSVPKAQISILDSQFVSTGPLLITHWGMSGPAILKLSAFAARELFARKYQFSIQINFVQKSIEECIDCIKDQKQKQGKKTIANTPLYALPKRLWQNLVKASNILSKTTWAEVNKKQIQQLAEQLTQACFRINGKSTFKDEFVTAGGVELKEMNCKTFECKNMKDLYVVGEAVNVDAITGGFNFQHAWTSGFLAAIAIASKY